MQNYQYLVLSPVKEDLVPTSNVDPNVLTKENMQFSAGNKKDGNVSL